MHKMSVEYENAQAAFEDVYLDINRFGHQSGNGTKSISNVGFYIQKPLDNEIHTPWRKWSLRYAQREWEWYKSGSRSVTELAKYAPIWDHMHRGDGVVNSNYGYQWRRNHQLQLCIEQLKADPTTRQAYVTIFDGKEKQEYEKDTPCTLNIGFRIEEGKLCMTVLMRSCDLWYGFCNDQYCFSNLADIVSDELDIPVGWYYHFASDFHIYERHYDLSVKSSPVEFLL